MLAALEVLDWRQGLDGRLGIILCYGNVIIWYEDDMATGADLGGEVVLGLLLPFLLERLHVWLLLVIGDNLQRVEHVVLLRVLRGLF